MAETRESLKHTNPLKTKQTNNLTQTERFSIKSLQKLPHTVIKPADKGGSLVLWPSTSYLNEAHKQLQNEKHYKKVQNNPIPTLSSHIQKYLQKIKDNKHIDHTTYKYLLPKNPPRTPPLYLLPKIHKPNMPGRPIISGCDSPTDKLSSFVDHFIKPLVPEIPSYIKDTNHFLEIIFNIPVPIPPTTLLVSIDVTSLYTNIPHDEGTRATLEALSHTPPQPLQPPTQVFQQMLEYILKHNYFSFNNEFYLQTQGTAMGTRMAPSYANLFMASLEKQILNTAPSQLKPLIWKRYIDDIFMIWPHGESSHTTPTNQISHACYTKTGTWSRRTQSYHKPSQKNQSQPSPDKPTYETYSYGATLVAQKPPLPPPPNPELPWQVNITNSENPERFKVDTVPSKNPQPNPQFCLAHSTSYMQERTTKTRQRNKWDTDRRHITKTTSKRKTKE